MFCYTRFLPKYNYQRVTDITANRKKLQFEELKNVSDRSTKNLTAISLQA